MAKIKNVYAFTNGNVMVFDEDGQQMPEFQDHMDKAIPKLIEAGYRGDVLYAHWGMDGIDERYKKNIEDFLPYHRLTR